MFPEHPVLLYPFSLFCFMFPLIVSFFQTFSSIQQHLCVHYNHQHKKLHFSCSLIHKRSPQKGASHSWFGRVFTPDGLPDATLKGFVSPPGIKLWSHSQPSTQENNFSVSEEDVPSQYIHFCFGWWRSLWCGSNPPRLCLIALSGTECKRERWYHTTLPDRFRHCDDS